MFIKMPKNVENQGFCTTPLQKLLAQLIININLIMTSNTIHQKLLVSFKIGLQINSI